MFEKQIDRDIKGVIKVGQSDEENIYQVLDKKLPHLPCANIYYYYDLLLIKIFDQWLMQYLF